MKSNTLSFEEICKLSDHELVSYLATLSLMEYDRLRETVAADRGVQKPTLDKLVKEARKGQEQDDCLEEEWYVSPYPASVNGEALFDEMLGLSERFVICDKPTRVATVVWAALTWLTDHVDCLPIANITAPEKNCGKSTLLEFIGNLACRPMTTSNITPSALFRSIEQWRPTLLIDEADSFADDNEALRGIINAGHTRTSAYVIRTVGDDHTPKRFKVWSAKALAGIGNRASTIESRSVNLQLRRKRPDEQVERMRNGKHEFEVIRQKLARWALDNGDLVRQHEPQLPDSLFNRDADNWEPLLAIAEIAGGKWPERARKAALELTQSVYQPSVSEQLLADIQEIFDERGVSKIFTKELLQALVNKDESPWETYNRGRELTPRQLSQKLEGYGIKPRTVRIDIRTKKGYHLDDFIDAFSRYLKVHQETSVTPSQGRSDLAYSSNCSVTNSPDVTDNFYLNGNEYNHCDVVTDEIAQLHKLFGDTEAQVDL